MKKVVVAAITCLSVSAFASVETESGRQLYLSPGKGGCATCHGETGNEPVMPMYPKIGGQMEMYLINQMQDYKLKKRKNGLFVPMEVAMEHYSDEDILQIAKYLASF
ncbi:cytochrome C [Photobacterium gaetbulicola]|uniref:Putative cytochrome c4 n=1 Tax=Photobacterium gaetbulicola Gung47 TaxID=658445 RepID=A0A0C5WFE3_9GAMM|nr:cytochrome c [Photobacterium gaetbulicola]AJR05843.1 putative cytochrome c4 [Photobacterium gaetbulicola Gung47]PSU13339.1 cytochrome C [Photobacterium gaetbulicola]